MSEAGVLHRAIDARRWETAALCLLVAVAEAADRLPPQALENRAQRVADVAALLEDHAAKHLAIIQQVSANENLPQQAVDGMQNGLEKAQIGFDQANVKSSEAKENAGPPPGRGPQR